MVTIKVFDSKGVKEIKCFDTLVDVPYLEEEILEETGSEESNPFA